MTDQPEQTTAQPSAVPARIELEDFIEAVSRGVLRALLAQEDVSGYALAGPTAGPGTLPTGRNEGMVLTGIVFIPPGPSVTQAPKLERSR